MLYQLSYVHVDKIRINFNYLEGRKETHRYNNNLKFKWGLKELKKKKQRST